MKKVLYNFPEGYAVVETPETIFRINDRDRHQGRIKLRYDIILRDGRMTVLHHDLTKAEVKAVRSEIESQGNQLW